MEPLETKIQRLSPELRKEVEDFVDFLAFRSDRTSSPEAVPAPSPPVHNVAPPPLTMIEPVHIAESSVSVDSSPADTRTIRPGETLIPAGMFEIGSGSGDRISCDYMDYGQFEQQPSPAVEAVKKVKARLIRPKEADRTNQLLDWID